MPIKNKNKLVQFDKRRISNRNPRLARSWALWRQRLSQFAAGFLLFAILLGGLLLSPTQSNNLKSSLACFGNDCNKEEYEAMDRNPPLSVNEYKPIKRTNSLACFGDECNQEEYALSKPSDMTDTVLKKPEVKEKTLEPTKANTGIKPTSGSRSSKFLGDGFTKKGVGNEMELNKMIQERGGEYAHAGVGTLNSLLYNIKDYFKTIAGGLALIWLMVSAFRLVTATADDDIKPAKNGIIWALVGLAAIFIIDIAVVSFYEGGKLQDDGTLSRQSLVSITRDADGRVTAGTITDNTNLFKSVATYFASDARAIFETLKVYGSALAFLFIVVAGIRMVTASGNDEGIEKQKKFLIHTITAFLTLLMVDTFIFQVIYPEDEQGYTSTESVQYLGTDRALAQAAKGSGQILAVVHFLEAMLGAVAVFFIVYSGMRIIGAMGAEDDITKQKKQLLWSIVGLGLVVLSESAVNWYFAPNGAGALVNDSPAGGQELIARVVNFLSTFIGIFSVVALLYAGVLWVANFGNQEAEDKAKKIIIAAILGVILSVSAYSIVNSIIAENAVEMNP